MYILLDVKRSFCFLLICRWDSEIIRNVTNQKYDSGLIVAVYFNSRSGVCILQTSFYFNIILNLVPSIIEVVVENAICNLNLMLFLKKKIIILNPPTRGVCAPPPTDK